MKFTEDEECYFVPDLKCKWPIDEETLKELMAERDPDGTYSLRPFEYSGTCRNCLLSMILSSLLKETK